MHSKDAQDTSMNKAFDFSLFGYKSIGKYRSTLLCVFEYYYPLQLPKQQTGHRVIHHAPHYLCTVQFSAINNTNMSILITKANEMQYFSALFGKELYMFRTDLLSISRSLNTVFIATGICHTGYVACLLARSGWNSVNLTETCRELHKIKLRNSTSCWLLL